MKAEEKATTLKDKIDPTLWPRLTNDVFLMESPDAVPEALNDTNLRSQIAIAQHLEAKELARMAAENGVRHIAQNTRSKFHREIGLATILIRAPQDFLKEPEKFILLGEKSCGSLSIPFRSSKDRDGAITKLLEFLAKIPGGEMVKDSLRILSDELITNALYNAPTDQRGQHQNAHFPRTKTVELRSGQTATISVAFDDRRLFISCEDPFGSLDERKFISGLASKYGSDELASVNMGAGGAGLGCRMLLDRSTELMVVCQNGVKTFFGCSILLGVSARELENTNKNLHLAFFK